MYSTNTSAGKLLRSELIDGVTNVIHGFGVRGVMPSQYLDALGIKDRFIVETDQMHGGTVHYLMWPKKGSVLEGDAFISDRPGMVCFVRGADCVPILIADTKRPAVAAVHAGWRGTVENVIGETLKAMKGVFGTESSDCVAAIGPAICGKCYEVGSEVVEAISKLDVGKEWLIDSNHVDLKMAVASLLQKSGVPRSNIDVSNHCTFCDPAFASWRRDHDEDERQFSFIMIT